MATKQNNFYLQYQLAAKTGKNADRKAFLCKAAPGAHRHKLAFRARSNAMQILAVGEEVTLAAARKATGANGEACLTLDLKKNLLKKQQNPQT